MKLIRRTSGHRASVDPARAEGEYSLGGCWIGNPAAWFPNETLWDPAYQRPTKRTHHRREPVHWRGGVAYTTLFEATFTYDFEDHAWRWSITHARVDSFRLQGRHVRMLGDAADEVLRLFNDGTVDATLKRLRLAETEW
jgi:hypothetical protein